MGNVIDNIKRFFDGKGLLAGLVIANIAVFVVIRLVMTVFTLFNLGDPSLLRFIELPADLSQIAKAPWTLLTYMFVHKDLLHILFNMLLLYWFGKVFLMFFNEKQLMAVYLLGGIAGALFYIVSFNLFPYFQQVVEFSYLIGASASVMGVVFGASFFKKDFRLNLLFIGSVKIYYIALVCLALDILAVTSSNAGGHWAHIGGATFGIAYALSYQKGKDLTGGLNKAIDRFVNLFKKKPTMKVSYQKREQDYKYNEKKNEKTQALDQILDKIKKSGYNSLTKEEKKRLFEESNK